MPVYKDKEKGTWYAYFYYRDWTGKKVKKMKRGFPTKREAEEWLRNFLVKEQDKCDMLFEDFLEKYYEDMGTRLREHTMRTKHYIIDLKVLPYSAKRQINEITAANIRKWQAELLKQGYAPTYLKSINNQVAAIFNYAARYYDLPNNPCRKAGSIGRSNADEMQFWTKEEFSKFIDCVMNKRQSYMVFMVLYKMIFL